MASEDREPALAQARGQAHLHVDGLRERHRVQVRVEARHEAFAAALDDARGLDAGSCDCAKRCSGVRPVMPT